MDTINEKQKSPKYPVFKPLADICLFKQFTVTDTLEWQDGQIDIAPEFLYNKSA